jgi:hypothetical protein
MTTEIKACKQPHYYLISSVGNKYSPLPSHKPKNGMLNDNIIINIITNVITEATATRLKIMVSGQKKIV